MGAIVNHIGNQVKSYVRSQLGSNVNPSPPFVPPDDRDISGHDYYTSDNIDDFLIHHAYTLNTTGGEINIRNHGNPTSKSLAAREKLNTENYVLIKYNTDFL